MYRMTTSSLCFTPRRVGNGNRGTRQILATPDDDGRRWERPPPISDELCSDDVARAAHRVSIDAEDDSAILDLRKTRQPAVAARSDRDYRRADLVPYEVDRALVQLTQRVVAHVRVGCVEQGGGQVHLGQGFGDDNGPVDAAARVEPGAGPCPR